MAQGVESAPSITVVPREGSGTDIASQVSVVPFESLGATVVYSGEKVAPLESHLTDRARTNSVVSITLESESSSKPKGENAPKLPFFVLLLRFLSFGLRAWGGPAAQIAMLKQELVVEGKWITTERFNRVFALMQAIPGPEAHELCCYFGIISRGRLGGLVAGFGFMFPGFVMMLILSWVYATYGIENQYFLASFDGIQPAVAAMIFRATHKLADHAFKDAETKKFSNLLFFIAAFSCLLSVLRINFFVTLPYAAILYVLVRNKNLKYSLAVIWLAAGIASFVVYCMYVGLPETASSLTLGLARENTLWRIFLLGLVGGLLTFGGAYTAIPFIQQDAVYIGQWITNKQFLDGLALGSIVPSPLVIFVCFVGFIGQRWGGAILMTMGMFIPAFFFPIVLHYQLNRILNIKQLNRFLDGVAAITTGLVFITACTFSKSAITSPLQAAIFGCALQALYMFKGKLTNMSVVLAAAIAGQLLFV